MFQAVMDLISLPLGGFVFVLIGTLFLFAEVVVRGRMIFAIVGMLAMSMYFIAHVQEGQFLLIAALYIIGLSLVVLDGKFVGDGTIAVIGFVVMLIGLALPAPNLLYGLTVASAFVIGAIGSLTFLKFFPKRDMWSKMTLTETLSSERGYNSMNEGYKLLVGKEGVSITRFNPTGSIDIEGKSYSATSQGIWIDKGQKVRVIEVSGTRILVEKLEEDEE